MVTAVELYSVSSCCLTKLLLLMCNLYICFMPWMRVGSHHSSRSISVRALNDRGLNPPETHIYRYLQQHVLLYIHIFGWSYP